MNQDQYVNCGEWLLAALSFKVRNGYMQNFGYTSIQRVRKAAKLHILLADISKQRNCFCETFPYKNSFNFQTLHIFAKKTDEILCEKISDKVHYNSSFTCMVNLKFGKKGEVVPNNFNIADRFGYWPPFRQY